MKLYIGLNEAYSGEGVMHPNGKDQDFIRMCLVFNFYPTPEMLEGRAESVANLVLTKYYDDIADSVLLDAPSYLMPFLFVAFSQYNIPIYCLTSEWGSVMLRGGKR